MPDKSATIWVMHRALKAGGRLAVETWWADDEIPFMYELRRVAEKYLDQVADQRHSFGDAGQLESVIREAGFHDLQSRVVSRVIRLAPDVPFARLNAMALVGMSEAGKAMTDEEREHAGEAIAGDSAHLQQAFGDNVEVSFELRTNLATARG